MKSQKKTLLAGSSVVVVVLGITAACILDDTGDPSPDDLRIARPDKLELAGDPGAAPDPDDVYIKKIVTAGSGCKPGTVVTQIAPDKKSFIVIFQDMLLQNPPGAPVKVKNCLASVHLHVPVGWQVSIATVNTRGYVFLEKGLTALETSKYLFAGDPKGYNAQNEIKGPFDDFYVFSDEVPVQSIAWSKCGASAMFGVNTSLKLDAHDNPTGSGILNVTDVDGAFRKEFQWQWQKC